MKGKISVIGAGSWGTTLAVLLAGKNSDVTLWVRKNELAKAIMKKKTNENYLPTIKIPDNVKIENSLKNSVSDAKIIITAIPTQFIRNIAKEFSNFMRSDSVLVNVAKGIEVKTHKRVSEVLKEETGCESIAVLSGPNHADEVSKKIPTATVIASEQEGIRKKIRDIFLTDYFKVYTHDDVTGVEICGALKNITAIATGIVDGLGYGDNARASIITLGLREMNNFGRFFGSKRATCYGLAGVGDLVGTCTSRLSRNRFVGEMIAKGKTMEEIKKAMHGMVAEGIPTTKAVYEVSSENSIDMPLTMQLYKVLYEEKELKTAINDFIKLI